jgi:methionyl-tRNA formyltransferase
MKSKPSIIYFGTPDFSAQVLEYLIEQNVPILGCVTQPDRPKGRSLQMQFSPVKEIALKRLPSVPIFQPQKCSDPVFLEQIAALNADLLVVVAFGQILPVKLLQIPPLGCINVHTSLLPKYRGAAPIQRSLMDGVTETGVAIQKMVKELDAGDIISSSKLSVPEDMSFGQLESALCQLSKKALLDVIDAFADGIPPAVAQDHQAMTYASKLKTEEGALNWTLPASKLHNLVRALSPRPSAWVWVEVNGERKRLKIIKAKFSSLQGLPAEVLPGKDLVVACGSDALHILEVQPEGKPRMNAQDWLRGAKSPVKFS